MAMPKPTKLKRTFLHYNRHYFSNLLDPETPVKWQNLGDALGVLWADDGIGISRKLRKSNNLWRTTLLHEMCHLATESERVSHGPRWQREMRRLARIGAFDKIW